MKKSQADNDQPNNDPQSSFEDAVFAGFSTYINSTSDQCLVLAALSGGADSSAMTAALASLSGKTRRFKVHAVHVNHNIRPPEDCEADEKTAAALCTALELPFSVFVIPRGEVEARARRLGAGIEAAARYFRYKALGEAAERLGAGAILTAHTQDDNLETILMAVLRGGGPAGLGGMAGISATPGLPRPPGLPLPLVRPLLSLSRGEGLAYLQERKLGYCHDTSNDDDHFLRNRIRRHLVPLLDEQFPNWRRPLLRLGETQAMASLFIKEEAEKRLSWKEFRIPSEQFFSQPAILREEALFQALDIIAEEPGGLPPRRDTLRAFAMGMNAAADLGYGRLENKNGWITVKEAEKSAANTGFSVLIKRAGTYKLNGITVIAGAEQTDSNELMFYASLPLVLYSPDKETIQAEDRQGRAAVIRRGKLSWKRKNVPAEAGLRVTIFLNGGSLYNGS